MTNTSADPSKAIQWNEQRQCWEYPADIPIEVFCSDFKFGEVKPQRTSWYKKFWSRLIGLPIPNKPRAKGGEQYGSVGREKR